MQRSGIGNSDLSEVKGLGAAVLAVNRIVTSKTSEITRNGMELAGGERIVSLTKNSVSLLLEDSNAVPASTSIVVDVKSDNVEVGKIRSS